MNLVEKRPYNTNRVNSKRAIIHPLLKAGKTRAQIMEDTGFTSQEVGITTKKLFQAGYFERPDPEERRRTKGLHITLAKGGARLAIEKYVPLDLSLEQTRVAIEVFDHLNFSTKQVRAAYRWFPKRSEITPGQWHSETRRDRTRSTEEILAIVTRRQVAYRYAQVFGKEKPTTLDTWRDLEEETRREFMELPTPEELDKLAKRLLNPIFVPKDPLAQRYLLNVANGLPGLNARLVQADPDLVKRNAVKADLLDRQYKHGLT